MKRELFCPDCSKKADKWLRPKQVWVPNGRFDELMTPVEAIGESFKKVPGRSLKHCECDLCGKPITPGDDLVAISIIKRDGDYYEWESAYIY